jgi:hypothetical protein
MKKQEIVTSEETLFWPLQFWRKSRIAPFAESAALLTFASFSERFFQALHDEASTLQVALGQGPATLRLLVGVEEGEQRIYQRILNGSLSLLLLLRLLLLLLVVLLLRTVSASMLLSLLRCTCGTARTLLGREDLGPRGAKAQRDPRPAGEERKPSSAAGLLRGCGGAAGPAGITAMRIIAAERASGRDSAERHGGAEWANHGRKKRQQQQQQQQEGIVWRPDDDDDDDDAIAKAPGNRESVARFSAETVVFLNSEIYPSVYP